MPTARSTIIKLVARPTLLSWLMITGLCSGCMQSAEHEEVACGRYTCDADVAHDSSTGLTWQRNLPTTYAGCTQHFERDGDGCTWNEAKAYCTQWSLDGKAWRLPTKDELVSLIDATQALPALDKDAFPRTPISYFWTATPYVELADYVWTVEFRQGTAGHLHSRDGARVRCVR